jgi:hypothetical protein
VDYNFGVAEEACEQRAYYGFLQVSVDYVYVMLFAELCDSQEGEWIILVVSQADEIGFDRHGPGICSKSADEGLNVFGVESFGYVFDNNRCSTIAKVIYYM